jgi:hypothetical protein
MTTKNLWILIGILAVVLAVGGYYFLMNATAPIEVTPAPSPSVITPERVVYLDTVNGFRFQLPESWKGYSIVSEIWTGQWDGRVMATGTKVSIRHPLWREDAQRQDIPVLVFTLKQWDDLSNERFSIGAAPIPPSELGRNGKNVFALPARYNFAFPEGFEEVETILLTKPLVPIQ